MFSCIPGLYPLDNNSNFISQVLAAKNMSWSKITQLKTHYPYIFSSTLKLSYLGLSSLSWWPNLTKSETRAPGRRTRILGLITIGCALDREAPAEWEEDSARGTLTSLSGKVSEAVLTLPQNLISRLKVCNLPAFLMPMSQKVISCWQFRDLWLFFISQSKVEGYL